MSQQKHTAEFESLSSDLNSGQKSAVWSSATFLHLKFSQSAVFNISKILIGNHSPLLKNSNPPFDATSFKMSSNLSITHCFVMLKKKLILFRIPVSIFFPIRIRGKNHVPLSLHHKVFSVLSQKNRDEVGLTNRHIKYDAIGGIISNSTFCANFFFTSPNLRFHSYLMKFFGNLFKPLSFRGRNGIVKRILFLTCRINATICRKKPCKPNDSFPQFLFADQSKHPIQLCFLRYLNIRGR